MKKTLLSAAFLFAAMVGANAQTFQTESFNSYTVGNLGTDITGETSGQGGWFTFTSGTGGSNSDFQIVAEGGEFGNVLQVTGSATTENKFAWTDGTAEAWENRDSGNNIFKLNAQFHTGATSTTANSFRIAIYGVPANDPEADAVTVAGFSLNNGTKNFQGLCYLNNQGTINTYLINFATGGLILPANQWMDIQVIFNQTTGRVSWISEAAQVDGYYDGAATGFNIVEVDIVSVGGTGNTVSSTFKVDNISMGAVATEEDELSVKNVAVETALVKVYPNPANDVINVSNAVNAIEKVVITDMNGRVVKSVVLGVNEAQINISDLSKGVYFLQATSNGASVTEKIVKK